jgi:cyclic pyranopterin phosphate synthase
MHRVVSPGEAPAVLHDACGRLVQSLRVSVTDRCNLRCSYCLPGRVQDFDDPARLLDFDGIVRAVRVACSLGIDRVRLTGGEPLVRPRVCELVARLKRETPVREVAMTTNGVLLARHVPELVAAGLDRLTVSLDSLRAERFRSITRFGKLDDVWRGIEQAAQAGLRPLKINVLVLAGTNDDELDAWAELTRSHDLVVRLLELMPIGVAGNTGGYVDLTRVRQRLAEEQGLRPVAGPGGNGPARYFQLPGALGTLGFITPISEHYCDGCSRFRLTARGELRPCLAHDLHVPLADAIRRGDDEAIAAGFREAAARKPRGHAWDTGAATLTRMSRLGG